jgi:hypothetical protein
MERTATNTLTWKKSSYSGAGPSCVEVAATPDAVAVRDSKNPNGPTLTFTPTTFTRFLASLR